tara:strand:- start:154 stop:624 length:471 start_codon:yes stop_codon:yes gene_type:complete
MFKKLKHKVFLIFIISLIIFFVTILDLQQKDITSIKFKLITSTHKDLPWQFNTQNSSLKIKIGEVTNIEYTIKNLSNKKTSGIASFAFYPKELKTYITKIDCFCYEKQILNAGESRKFILTVMIDPEVTKDSKTNSLDEGIMQFIFFDTNNFKNIN